MVQSTAFDWLLGTGKLRKRETTEGRVAVWVGFCMGVWRRAANRAAGRDPVMKGVHERWQSLAVAGRSCKVLRITQHRYI